MNFSSVLRSFYKPCSKKFGQNIWVPILIQQYRYTFGYNIVSNRNLPTKMLVNRRSQIMWNTHTEKPLVGIFSNWSGGNVSWIYPESISASSITEKTLIWLAGLRKNMKSCQIKGSLDKSCQKNNPVFGS